MPKIYIIKTMLGSPDAATVIRYEVGETYDMPRSLFDVFIREGWGRAAEPLISVADGGPFREPPLRGGKHPVEERETKMKGGFTVGEHAGAGYYPILLGGKPYTPEGEEKPLRIRGRQGAEDQVDELNRSSNLPASPESK